MKRQPVYVAAASLSAVIPIVAAATIGMAFALQSDVAAVAKRARAAARAEESLRTEIASLETDFAALQGSPAPAMKPVPASVAATPAAAVSAGPARAVKVDARVPPECTFRSGDSTGLMDCIRRQQDRIGKVPAHPFYR